MKIKPDNKLFVLQILTGLVVAFVRHNLQYQRYGWESFGQFFGSWFVHTIGLLLLTVITIAVIAAYAKKFLGYEKPLSQETINESMFSVTMTVLIASVSIFFIAHWVPIDDE